MGAARHPRREPWIAILILAILTPAACDAVSQDPGTESFIIDQRAEISGAPIDIDLPAGLTVNRSRPVALNPSLTMGSVLAIGDRLSLDLFPDTRYLVVVDRITSNIHGTRTVRARIETDLHGYVLVSTTAGKSLGTIKIPARHEHYALVPAPDGQGHYLLDITGRIEAPCCRPMIPSPPTPEEDAEIERLQQRLAEKSPGPFDWASIDVMIVYTPAAAEWVDAQGGNMENIMAQAMETAQLTLDNSLAYLRVNLVFSSLVDYTESGSYSTDLRRLTFSAGSVDDPDGHMDEVHEWRDQHEADLVVLLAVMDIGGVAWLLDSTRGRPGRGFSMTNVTRTSFDYTFTHEIGHNMGCGHHMDQNVQPGPGLVSDSSGWRWTGVDEGRYCSVMTYPNGRFFADGIDHTQLAHFSNPHISYQGIATGHLSNGNNTRIIRVVKHAVAAYRGERPPQATRLVSVYPNPFNTGTTIAFELARTSHVDLRIFDLRGRLVRVVESGTLAVGRYQLRWDGTDHNGQTVSSGTYFCRFIAGEHERIVSMTFVK